MSEAKLSPRLGIVILLVIATTFGANHVAARVAFDHGASVAAAVSARSGFTAMFLFVFLKLQGMPMAMPRTTFIRSLVVGALVAFQSFSLYSAVARIPVAIALLVFSTSPMMLMLLYWATKKERPSLPAFVTMLVALAGLSLVLGVQTQDVASPGASLAPGVSWALAAALSFAAILFCNVHWLKDVDGRLRTLLMMATTALIVLAVGAGVRGLALPVDSAGWLGLILLTVLYGTAITALFIILPRLQRARSTVALNFEPIAVLGIAWVFLGQSVTLLQVLGALVVVGAIAWLATARD